MKLMAGDETDISQYYPMMKINIVKTSDMGYSRTKGQCIANSVVWNSP